MSRSATSTQIPHSVGFRSALARIMERLSLFFGYEAAPNMGLDALQRETDRIRLQSRHWLA